MIIGLNGNLSGGKTITAVKLLYDDFIKGRKIISNINLNFDDELAVMCINNHDLISLIKNNYSNPKALREIFEDTTFFMDEVGFLINARSRGNLNELITGFLMMVGKLNCNVIYTSQIQQSQTDLRLREITNVICFCQKISAINYQPIIFGERIVKEPILIQVEAKFYIGLDRLKRTKTVFNPSPYYHMYDTKEITTLDRSQYLRGGVKDLRKW